MKIALLQGGGTCPGSNDAHLGLAKRARGYGHEIVFIPNGFKGLITPRMKYQNILEHPLIREKGLDGLHLKPGCEWGTSRTKPIPSVDENGKVKRDVPNLPPEEQEAWYRKNLEMFKKNTDIIQENLTQNQIDMLCLVGGDDTLWRGGSMLYSAGVLRRRGRKGMQTVQTLGIPKTIDNDFLRIAYSYGATSAGLRGQEFVREGRVEADINGKLVLIEGMGRNCGWLAGASAEESADGVLIPEIPLSQTEVIEAVQNLIRERGKNIVLVVAEGFPIDGKKVEESGHPDAYGHRRLGGVRYAIQKWLDDAGIDSMQMCPGYLFRSGPPTERDANFAFRLGWTAMDVALVQRRNGVIPYLPEGCRSLEDKLQFMEMSEIRGGKTLDPQGYDPDTLRYTRPLMPDPEKRS